MANRRLRSTAAITAMIFQRETVIMVGVAPGELA
jgi:hypothetical protein